LLHLCLSFLDPPPWATCCPIQELLRGNMPPLPPDWSLLLGDSWPTSEFHPILIITDFILCAINRSICSTGSPAHPGLLSSSSCQSCGRSGLDYCLVHVHVSASPPPLPGTHAPLRCCVLALCILGVSLLQFRSVFCVPLMLSVIGVRRLLFFSFHSSTPL
jgi:hypothetical protein